jgi:hypothetical protein
MAKIPFIGSSYQARSKTIDLQECVNLYPEMGGSKSVASLIGTPGLVKYCTLPDGKPIRGLFCASNERVFAACGFNVYEIIKLPNRVLGGSQLIGTLGTNTGRVNFADNGRQLIIVDGQAGHIYNFGSTVYETIADEFFPNGMSVKFIDGYFVCNKPGTGEMYISASYDGLVWQSQPGGVPDFITAESSPDNLVTIAKVNNELWLSGRQTSEIWYDAGSADTIFERIHGGLNDIGCAAADSVASNGSALFWLGSNSQGVGVVWMATSYQPQRISTHGIEYLISTFDRIDDADAFCYKQEGH